MNVHSRFTIAAIIAAAAVSGCSAGAPTRSGAAGRSKRDKLNTARHECQWRSDRCIQG
jgi:hypothetical protein